MGDGKRILHDFEKEARIKMGKGIYAFKPLSAGSIITMDEVFFKTPANGTPPYMVDKILGKRLKVDLAEELPIPVKYLE
jgi:sialic acid synthase SpsE